MADPTQVEVETQLKNAVDIIEETRKFARDNAKNFIDMQDAYVQSIESDFAASAVQTVDAARAALNSVFAGASILTPVFRAEGKRIKAPETAILAILGRSYDDFVDNGRTVASRNFTFGTPVLTGGSVGDGELLRLNKDENDFDVENQTPDTVKKSVCFADQITGARRNQERFTLEGGFGGIDRLDIEGVGRVATIQARSSLDSGIDNPGFDSLENTAADPTDIPGWDVTTTVGGVLTIDSTNFTFLEGTGNIALPAPDGNTTVRSLNIKALDARLEQNLIDKGIVLRFDRPRMMRTWYNREIGTADGDIRITFGTKTRTITLAAETGWNKIDMVIDEDLWYKNYKTENPVIRVERLNATTGELAVDDVTFVEFTPFDGGWYLLLPGQIPFQRRDQLDWSDTIPSDTKIQRAIVEAFGVYLPSTTGVASILDPV